MHDKQTLSAYNDTVEDFFREMFPDGEQRQRGLDALRARDEGWIGWHKREVAQARPHVGRRARLPFSSRPSIR